VAEERLKLAVFIDFDNIQIGVKETLGKDFDVSVVLEALKERGEIITKVAYSDWSRANEYSRQMTQHAVQMVQRNVTPRGDKNGADINLALDALEMAFNRHHINAFAIVGGDSDFIALVEKLKQYDKRVFVVGGRSFTSNILQRNCTEFVAYENLLRAGDGGGRQRQRRADPGRSSLEVRPLSDALPNVKRALGVLAEREVSPQLGLIKSTLLQLDSTFSERDYGAGSFLEFMQKMEQAHMVVLRKLERGYRVEIPESALEEGPAAEEEAAEAPRPAAETREAAEPVDVAEAARAAMDLLRRAVELEVEKSPNRPLYLRHIRHGLRAADKDFDERRAGFQSLTDLLHRAQRDGWLSLQRDRKGVLRMFYRPQADVPEGEQESAETAAAEAAGETATSMAAGAIQGEAAASTDFWESPETLAVPTEEAEESAEAAAGATDSGDGAATITAEIAGAAPHGAAEAAPTPKRRGRRPARGTQRKSTSRRKTKEKTAEP
jgi:uncharacterized protein (TIGR00288 family)